MQGILTPDEIRDLLRKPSDAGPVCHLWTGDASAYDILQGGAKGLEQMRTVQTLHAELPAQLAAAWSGAAGKTLQCVAAEYEYVAMADALAQIAVDGVAVVRWNEPGVPLDGVLTIDRGLLFALYATQFGGDAGAARGGPLTLLEKSFCTKLLTSLLQLCAVTWKSYGAGEPSVAQLLDSQEAVAGLGWTNDAFRTVWTVQEGEATLGALTWVLPRELGALVDGGGSGGGARNTISWRAAAEAALEEVTLSIQVELAACPLHLRDLQQMAAGTIWPLSVHQHYPVFVQGRPLYLATLGAVGEQRAIRIAEVM